jgi:hypothetical protein
LFLFDAPPADSIEQPIEWVNVTPMSDDDDDDNDDDSDFLFRGGIITITLITTDNINIVLFEAFIFVGFFRQGTTRGILQLSTYLLLMLHATILKPTRKQFFMWWTSTWREHTMFWPWRTRITGKEKTM